MGVHEKIKVLRIRGKRRIPGEKCNRFQFNGNKEYTSHRSEQPENLAVRFSEPDIELRYRVF